MTARKTRPAVGRAIFYSRDSGGKHETTPGQYVGWAQTEAQKLGVQFSGTAADIEELIASKGSQSGDIYFDNCVAGNLLSRPGLDALLKSIESDNGISHVFIPRRDRLARPDHPSEGTALEKRIGEAGVTIVFQGRIVPPLSRGKRQDIGEAIVALVEYDASGKFRDEHAEKMIWAKRALAEKGHSTGGRPPYGFRRFLVGPGGTVVRPLVDGERVRLAGHHVEWRPGPQEEIDRILRIAKMLETMPANRVAKILTAEGVPAPDSGRIRHDNGIPHVVRGVWHQTTIAAIARNSLLRALVEFGRRAMGDRRRLTTEGMRLVDGNDLRADGKPKVIQNPREVRIVAPASFTPILSETQAARLDEILDARAGTQKGKPRSRDPERNPLGGRIYDMSCSWPMYRAAQGQEYLYRCGLYQQSDGGKCNHNRINGPAAARAGLAILRQQFLNPELRDRLRARLEAKLQDAEGSNRHDVEAHAAEAALTTARNRLGTIERNMAEADTRAQLEAMKRAFNEAAAEVEKRRVDVDRLRAQSAAVTDIATKADQALAILDRLPELVDDAERQGMVVELFRIVDLKMFLSFAQVKKTKRTVNQLAGGVVTIGAAPAPIQPYSGPTARQPRKSASEMVSEAPPSGEGEQSLRNESRGDRI